MNKNYSDWFKVDLHIHSDSSNQTKTNDYDGTFDIEVLKTKLIENEVKLFSLTDHNIINVQAYRDYYEGYSEGDPNLLLGCEFDIRVAQNDGTFLTYHTLIIFDEQTISKAEEISVIIENHFEGSEIKDRSLTIDEVFELFSKYHFFFIPHAGGHKNIIDAYKRTDIKVAQEMVLLMECAHEKVKEKYHQKFNEEFDKLKDPDFRNKEGEAFLNFSDNHNCHEYPTPKSGIEHEFYCIKGEPTFETLRFAFIDPLSRIRKHSEVDKLKNVKKYISVLKIAGIEDVDDCTIDFSPNLNVIIGGASSGKSLLFNLIGKKIESKKHVFPLYGKDDTNVFIKASNSSTFQETLPFNNEEIVYIKQGDVVKYFEKGDLRELITEAGKEDDFSSAKENLQAQKAELIDAMEEFKNKFDRLNISYHKDFTLQEGDIENMLSDKFHFSEILRLPSPINYFEKEQFLNELLSDTVEFERDEVYDFTYDETDIIEKFQFLLESKLKFIQNKDLLEDTKQEFVDNVIGIIDNKNYSLEASSRAKSEAFRRKRSLIDTCKSLFHNATDFNKSCQTLSEYNFKLEEKIEVSESVALIIEVDHETELKKCIIKCINDGDESIPIYKNYLSLLKDNSKLKDYDGYSETRLLRKINVETRNLLNKFDSPNTYLDYGENGNSKNKSPGYNAEMYLKTILEQENCKLVMIDQPEDNLGNTFKNENLINLLRDIKFKKQIILVTHNPSIVVYGDAENIILAENQGGIITYNQLVLENKDYQKLIINNLDGGKSIFNMRSRKYNIKKLLNS